MSENEHPIHRVVDPFEGATPAIVRIDPRADWPGEPTPRMRWPSHPSAVAVLEDVVGFFETRTDLPFEAPDEEFLVESWFDFGYLDGYEEIERYWVARPYAYVTVLFDEDEKEYCYRVVEPELDAFERYVRRDLLTLLRNSLMYIDLEAHADREAKFMEKATELVDAHAATVEGGTLHKVLYYLQRDFVHYGPIDAVMRDRSIEDVSCDGTDVPVFVYHREYRDLRTNVRFDRSRLNSFAVRLAQRAGKQLSVSDPLVDASLPDGSRVQLTLGGDVSTRGSNFTIRKFADIPYTPVDLVDWNTFSVEEMAYFWLAIENNRSLLFAGGTGSGKTTSMNAVSFFVPGNAKVVSIEDTREIDLPHDNWIASVSRPSIGGEGRGEVSMYDLLQAALRQRPEYLLVGEIRTEQNVALTFFQAMVTGHTCYTTVHADSVETAISRLQNEPLSVPTQMLQDLDVVSVQRQTFVDDRRVRRNRTVTELLTDSTDPDELAAKTVFQWDPERDEHVRVAESGVLREIARDRGWSGRELREQLRARETVLQYLVDEGITGYARVAAVVQRFAKDPDAVLSAVEDGDLALPNEATLEAEFGPATPVDDGRPRTDDPETWKRVLADAGEYADAGDDPAAAEAPLDLGDGDAVADGVDAAGGGAREVAVDDERVDGTGTGDDGDGDR